MIVQDWFAHWFSVRVRVVVASDRSGLAEGESTSLATRRKNGSRLVKGPKKPHWGLTCLGSLRLKAHWPEGLTCLRARELTGRFNVVRFRTALVAVFVFVKI